MIRRAWARSSTTTSATTRRETWRFVGATWLVSRVLFLVTGLLADRLLSHTGPAQPPNPHGLLHYWANWDGAWYSAIARYGYFKVMWPSSSNFFPFYPLLVRIGILFGGGPAVTGVVISLAASLAALYFVHELARDLFDRDVARAATLALAFFPTAFFFNAVYTEAVFLAAAAGSVWAARTQGNFLLAGVLGCIAAMTRNVGVFLLLPLAEEWWRRRQEVGPSALAPLALVPAGLAAYMFWLWRWSSHPLLFSTMVHKTWGRTLTNPFTVLNRAWEKARYGAPVAAHPWRIFETVNPNSSYDVMGTIDYVVLLIFVVLLAVAIVRLPWGLAAYAILGTLLPVLTPPQFLPLASLSRYALALFPAFIVLGLLLARRRYLLYGWLAASALVGVLITLDFTTWRWAG